MAVSITLNIDPAAGEGEIVEDLYTALRVQGYTPECLIAILCAVEFTGWGVDPSEAYMMQADLRNALRAAVESVVEKHRNGV